MAYNKVLFPDKTVAIDLTQDTVTEETLAVGVTAHNKAGEQIVGTAEFGGGESCNLQENVTVQSTTVDQVVYPSSGYVGFAKVTVQAVINSEGDEDMANTYSLYVYKSDNTEETNKWEVLSETSAHKYKFTIDLPHPTITNDYLYLHSAIRLDIENEGAQKTVFKTLQTLNSDKFIIYSDMDIDCKIILKGY